MIQACLIVDHYLEKSHQTRIGVGPLRLTMTFDALLAAAP